MKTEHRTTSMHHVGMNRDAIKTAIMSRLNIGQQYLIISDKEPLEDKRNRDFVKYKLLSFGKNAAVFEYKNSQKETFTYQDLWKMILDGEFK